MADMTAADGKKMTIGISVDGSEIAAYACNGTDDEAWFFGKQADGQIDVKSASGTHCRPSSMAPPSPARSR